MVEQDRQQDNYLHLLWAKRDGMVKLNAPQEEMKSPTHRNKKYKLKTNISRSVLLLRLLSLANYCYMLKSLLSPLLAWLPKDSQPNYTPGQTSHTTLTTQDTDRNTTDCFPRTHTQTQTCTNQSHQPYHTGYRQSLLCKSPLTVAQRNRAAAGGSRVPHCHHQIYLWFKKFVSTSLWRRSLLLRR